MFLSAFFSSSETAFLSLNRYRLQAKAEKDQKARGIFRLLSNIEELLSTILIGNTLVNIAAASTATFIFAEILLPHNKEKAVVLSTIFTTAIILFFAEILPKTIAATYPEKLSFRYYYPIRFFIKLFKPLSYTSAGLVRLFLKLIKPSEEEHKLTREELEALIFTHLPKDLKGVPTEILRKALKLERKKVREIMVPRSMLVAIRADASLKEIIKIIEKHGFSRYPVYKERLDNIIGVLFVKDIIPHLRSRHFEMDKFLRRAHFVPVYANLLDVMKVMREQRLHMVIVVDEFSTVRGIVTLEDILEEMVGEIWDEHEKEIEKVVKVGEKEFLVPAFLSIEEVNEETGLKLPMGRDYFTLAGLILKLLDRIPEEGEKIAFENLEFEVLKKRRNAIVMVKIKVLNGGERENESGGNK